MLKLVGSRNMLGDRAFSLKDSIGAITPSTLSLPDNWYGGMVKKMYKTKEGLLLCADSKDNIINIAYEDIVSNIYEEQAEEEPQEQEEHKEFYTLESMERKELIELAKGLGVEGKLATFKTEKLIEMIREIQK